MSLRVFQAALARMVIEPAFRERVRARGEAALGAGEDLTPLERRRLCAAASDRGMDATRMMHRSFRLTKLYTMLPLTRTLVGRRRLSAEIDRFWSESLPVSHYFLEECVAFCDYLLRRAREGLRVKYLAEVVSYERANLELRRPRVNGRGPQPQAVSFRHAPEILLAALLNGRRPRAVPPRPCTLLGEAGDDGRVEWHALEENRAAPPKRRARARR